MVQQTEISPVRLINGMDRFSLRLSNGLCTVRTYAVDEEVGTFHISLKGWKVSVPCVRCGVLLPTYLRRGPTQLGYVHVST